MKYRICDVTAAFNGMNSQKYAYVQIDGTECPITNWIVSEYDGGIVFQVEMRDNALILSPEELEIICKMRSGNYKVINVE